MKRVDSVRKIEDSCLRTGLRSADVWGGIRLAVMRVNSSAIGLLNVAYNLCYVSDYMYALLTDFSTYLTTIKLANFRVNGFSKQVSLLFSW
jgi:hypothetical protein